MTTRPAPMSVYNGILRSYFLLGSKISFASNNDEKLLTILYIFVLPLVAGENGFQHHVATSKT